MRLKDGDALLAAYDAIHEGEPGRARQLIENAPTVDVLPKLWDALYAEEDKFEKRYIGTSEHDNWFLIYRPWLQNGFEIAIKVLSELLTPEPPKEADGE